MDNHFAQLRSGLAAAAIVALTLPVAVRANELGSGVRPASFTIHDAAETMRDFCSTDANGVLWLNLPGGARYELVTNINDPAIANHGDGQFHAFDAAEVSSALHGVRFSLAHVSADVFILPFPRRNGLESAAGPGLILLSPGVRTLTTQQQHAEFTHELGHVVQYQLMPDNDDARWSEYRSMRGITDTQTYTSAGAHSLRPHEIFAEDFRALYGDAQATYSGTIENASLAYPTQVAGLSTFMTGLAAAPFAGKGPLTVMGGSTKGAVMMARAQGGVAPLDVYDVTGRKLVTVLPQVDGNGATWTWDGRDAQGRTIHANIVFARARDGIGGTTKLVRE
jgi:hypothetical protein